MTTTKRGHCCSRSAFGKVRFLGHKNAKYDFFPFSVNLNTLAQPKAGNLNKVENAFSTIGKAALNGVLAGNFSFKQD